MRFSPRFIAQSEVFQTTEKQGVLSIQFNEGFQHIRRLPNSCIQIQVSKNEAADFFSYALIQNDGLALTWEEDEEVIEIQGLGTFFLEKETGQWQWHKAPYELLQSEDGLGFGFLGEEVVATFSLEKGQQFFGLGEKTGKLNRRGSAFTNWNTDAFAYSDGRDPLYASIPFYLSVNQGVCYGILVDNTSKTRFNFGASNDRMVQISVAQGPLNLIFIPGPTPQEVLKHYGELTGTTPMPPKWALGLQQCRYSYYPEHEVVSIANNYRNRDIPCDVIYLDIHYMQDYKVFTVNEDRFPDLKKLTQNLGDQGFRVIPIQDPGIKVEPGYPPFDSGKVADIFVKYPDGKHWNASVWPGNCAFPDFTAEAGRNWWTQQTADWVKETGVGGLWNDMNEPATWGQDVPDMLEFSLENRGGSHLEAHNVYGQLMAQSSREGLIQARPEERPFVLTRAGFAGIQRYAAVWTGDNVANDEHMFLGIRLVLSLGMSGVPFSGMDVGGFVGDSSADLFVRWMSVASFFPFFRIHSMIDSKDNEPWSYGEQAEAIVRNYIRLRYKLMPMLYSSFWEHQQSGKPVLKPYFWAKRGYEYEQGFEHQFLLGDSILVIPASSTQQAVWAELPEGNWFHLFTGQRFTGNQQTWIGAPLHTLPVLVKAGSMLITQKVGTHTLDIQNQEFQLHVFKGSGSAELFWYDDNGLSSDVKEEDRIQVRFNFDFELNVLKINRVETGKKPWPKMTIHLWHFQEWNDTSTILINGRSASLQKGNFAWLDPLPNFDPFEDKGRRFSEECWMGDLKL